MREKRTSAMDRRNFLRAVGGVSTAAVAAVAAPIAATEAQAYDPGREETKERYLAGIVWIAIIVASLVAIVWALRVL